jgi:hypothetical protein
MPLPAPPQGTDWQVVFDTSVGPDTPSPRVLRCNEILTVAEKSTVLLESRTT